MKIKITIGNIIVEINRASVVDFNNDQNQDKRMNIMKDTVMPMLKEAVAQALIIYAKTTEQL